MTGTFSRGLPSASAAHPVDSVRTRRIRAPPMREWGVYGTASINLHDRSIMAEFIYQMYQARKAHGDKVI